MSSQFDALLDFGDDPPPTTNGTAQNGSDFDPFGSRPLDNKGGSDGGGLLLDFSMGSDVSKHYFSVQWICLCVWSRDLANAMTDYFAALVLGAFHTRVPARARGREIGKARKNNSSCLFFILPIST
jgi:hypothetical protein